MSINLIPLNGKCPLIDYDEFEKSFIKFLGPRCIEATMYIYNNFQAPVSSELNIDLLFLVSIENISGNFSQHTDKKGNINYFKNAILPITFNNQFKESQIEVENNFLLIDGYEHHNEDELNSLKFGLLNFLTQNCRFEKKQLFIHPVEFIANNNYRILYNHSLVAPAFEGELFFSLLKSNSISYFDSYRHWSAKKEGYIIFKEHAAEINESASKFTEFGFLTSRKIERIAKQLTSNSAMYEAIGKQPTLIVGKAGTGKTAHLLHLIIRCLSNNTNVTLLTYNHLLTKDIAYQVKMIKYGLYEKWKGEGRDPSQVANASVQTLMGFIFRLSKSLGVLHLMTEQRIIELKLILQKSLRHLVDNLPALFQEHSNKIFGYSTNWNAAVEVIQNAKWDRAIKEYGIAFVKYLKGNNKSLTNGLKESSIEFYTLKLRQLEDMTQKDVFLGDYTGCLKNTLDVIRDTETFYNGFNVSTKFELLELLMDLKDRKQDDDLKNGIISLEVFTKRIKNVIKGRVTKNRILFIDEGQDCHSFEREIFYEMFKPEKVVSSFGGREQLIRFSDTCKWEFFKGRKIDVRRIPSGNKSYRIKRSILDFCNFVADANKIDLKLQPYSDEDPGEVIFDFRNYKSIKQFGVFPKLLEKGAVNGCKPLESLMIMDVNSRETGTGTNYTPNETLSVVNEYGVLEDVWVTEYKEFNYLHELANHSEYWVGAVADKGSIRFPSPNEVRVINYESCRGLEAWSTMCFNIDKFFNGQYTSAEAEKYLLQDDMYLTKEQRASMFASTWILMAITRAIDTLYLQMSNMENEFVKLCLAYARANPKNCTTIGLTETNFSNLNGIN